MDIEKLWEVKIVINLLKRIVEKTEVEISDNYIIVN